MNKFAQLMYGKVIFIYETELPKEQLSTIFDPSTFWVDVTGQDVEVGDIVSFDPNVGLVFKKPEVKPQEEKTLAELKAEALEKVKSLTEAQITGGFIMEIEDGEYMKFDSDVDTQNTMALIYSASQTEGFNELPPYYGKIPCRGYKLVKKVLPINEVKENDLVDEKYVERTEDTVTILYPEETKTIIYLDKEGIQKFVNELTLHIGKCKQAGWINQQRVAEAETPEDLEEWFNDGSKNPNIA